MPNSEKLTAAQARELFKPGKGSGVAQKRTTLPRPASAPPKQNEAIVGQIPDLPPPTFGAADEGPASWLIGGQCISRAGSHFGDRHRLTVTGPADAGLLAALLRAARDYYHQRP